MIGNDFLVFGQAMIYRYSSTSHMRPPKMQRVSGCLLKQSCSWRGGGGGKGSSCCWDTLSLWMDLFSLDSVILIIVTCNCLTFSYSVQGRFFGDIYHDKC